LAKWVKGREKRSRKRHPVRFADLEDLKKSLVVDEELKPKGRDNAALEIARTAMLDQIKAERISEFQMKYLSGKRIIEYEAVYGKGRGWRLALDDIAGAHGGSTKQIYRRFDFYHESNRLPEGQLESILDGSLAAPGSKEAVLGLNPRTGVSGERSEPTLADTATSVPIATELCPQLVSKLGDDLIAVIKMRLEIIPAAERKQAAFGIRTKVEQALRQYGCPNVESE